jgi:DNA invertase Pin-like site-specific DNA recombinase
MKGGVSIKTYAYCRVSSADQNEDRQLDAIAELNIPRNQIFTDKVSGKDFNRPSYQTLLKKLKQGDLLYIKSIDRLGRNYEDIQSQWRVLTKERGVDVVVLDMPILDTRKDRDLMGIYIADTILALLSFVAQKEREDIRIRQREGIAAAKARGIHIGRPIKRPPENFADVVKDWERGRVSFNEALARTGLKQATFYNRLRDFRNSGESGGL